jgi:hypothetical protein
MEQIWLTLEEAAVRVKQPLDRLNRHLTSASPVSRFQALGLLFDKVRHEAGEPCLQPLEAEEEELTPPTEEPPKPDAPSDLKSANAGQRSYRWEEMPITVQLRWQPTTRENDRQVLITATTYDDFPLAMMVDATALEGLPLVILQLLDALQQQLSVRQLQHQQTTKPTAKTKRSPTPTPTPSPSPTKAVEPPTSTQITLF